jgi:hypothetical protein
LSLEDAPRSFVQGMSTTPITTSGNSSSGCSRGLGALLDSLDLPLSDGVSCSLPSEVDCRLFGDRSIVGLYTGRLGLGMAIKTERTSLSGTFGVSVSGDGVESVWVVVVTGGETGASRPGSLRLRPNASNARCVRPIRGDGGGGTTGERSEGVIGAGTELRIWVAEMG